MAADSQPQGEPLQETVARNGGGFLQGLITAPFNTLGGLAKGVLSWETVVNGFYYGLGVLGLRFLVPDLTGAAVGAVAGDKARDALKIGDKTLLQVAAESMGIGLAASGVMNGASGAINGVTSGFGGEGAGSTAASVGSMVAGGIAFAGIAAVAIGAAKNYAETGSLSPAPVPPKAAGGTAKTT